MDLLALHYRWGIFLIFSFLVQWLLAKSQKRHFMIWYVHTNGYYRCCLGLAGFYYTYEHQSIYIYTTRNIYFNKDWINIKLTIIRQKNNINSFYANFPFLYSLKPCENKRFSNVFSGIQIEYWWVSNVDTKG